MTPHPFRRSLRMLAVLAAFVLVTAACGGGSDADDTAPADDVDASSDSSAAPTTAAPTTAAPTTVAAASSDDFCEGAAAVDMRIDELNEEFAGIGDRFEAFGREVIPMQIEVLRNPPSEIADASAEFITGLEELAAILEPYDYDIFAVPPDEMDQTGDFEDAADEVEAYLQDVCGIDTTDIDLDQGATLDASDVDRLLNGPNRDLLLGELTALGLTEEQSECAVRETMTTGTSLSITADPAAMVDILTGCGVSIDQLIDIGLASGDADPQLAAQLSQFEALLTPEFLELMQTDETVQDLIAGQLVGVGLERADVDCLIDRMRDEPVGSIDGLGDLIGFLLDCGVSLDALSNLNG